MWRLCEEGMDVKPYEITTHTADVAILVRGRDMADLLRNAARAFYELVLEDASGLSSTLTRELQLESVDADTMLIDWINELVYMIDAEQLVFATFHFGELGPSYLVARAQGEYLDPSRHQLKREVKAATYHMSHISETSRGLDARIILDV